MIKENGKRFNQLAGIKNTDLLYVNEVLAGLEGDADVFNISKKPKNNDGSNQSNQNKQQNQTAKGGDK